MVTVGGNDRVNVQITWPKVLTLVVPVVAALGLGYVGLVRTILDGYNQRLNDASQSIQNSASESAAIRVFAEAQSAALRSELGEVRKDFSAQLEKLGDRIVSANTEIGDRIDRLRMELIGSMDRRDAAIGVRFDRLDQKMDNMLTKITYEPAIEVPAGTYMIDAKGNVLGEKGEFLGTLPVVLKPSILPYKPE